METAIVLLIVTTAGGLLGLRLVRQLRRPAKGGCPAGCSCSAGRCAGPETE